MSTTDTPPPPPPPPPTGPSGPRISGPEARDLGTLRRTTKASPEGRHLAGVAGGLARHFDVDPVIVRVLLVVLVFFGGAGLLLYGAGWLLVPEEGSERATIQLDDRSRSLALYVAGALAALAILGDTVGRFDFPWPLAIIALIVLVVVSRREQFRSGQRRPRGTVPPPAYGPTGTGPGAHDPATYDAATYRPATYDPATYDPATYDPAAYDADAFGPTSAAASGAAPAGGATAAGGPATAPGAGPTVEQPPASWDIPAGAYGQPGYGPPAYGPPAYGPPAYGPPTYVSPPNPRKRGPVLFWFTLALIALGLGTLGIVDAAGASVPDSAYPALAVGITGAMLVLGAFWGRAGGLILVGLLATVGLVGTTANHEFGNNAHRVHEAPATAAAVHDDYRIDAGELVVDLTHVSDPAALNGRTITVKGGVGKLAIVVPDDWGVHAEANVGIGSARVLANGESGGFGISQSGGESGEIGAPEVRFDVNLGVGAIQVMRASSFPWPDHDFSGWRTR